MCKQIMPWQEPDLEENHYTPEKRRASILYSYNYTVHRNCLVLVGGGGGGGGWGEISIALTIALLQN